MYRLANMKSRLIQRLVTREIIRGMDALFGLVGEMDMIPVEALEGFIKYSEVLSRVKAEYPALPGALMLKLASMRKAMKDPDNEYTFDEFGEFLLYEMIQYAQSLPDFEMDWEAEAGEEEEKELREIIADILSDEDDLADDQREDLIQQTVDAITRFPNLADELDGETAFRFLYWDTDFMFYYNVVFDVIADFFRQDNQMGFSGGEMQKYPILRNE